MSRRPIARSADLKRLQDEGFDIEVRDGYLVMRQVPYLTESRQVRRDGILISPLDDMADDKTSRPKTHVVHFVGEHPCHKDGRKITEMVTGASEVRAGELAANWQCSAMPEVPFRDHYAKMTNYVNILAGPAQVHVPDAKAQVFPVIPNTEVEESVFLYEDTASSRANIVEASRKLAMGKVAIVGLGGTGGYILDFVAKTPVREIHLFDGDTFLQHNAFRAPGAASGADLEAKKLKVAYHAQVYGRMRRGVIPHPFHITADNAGELEGMNFVFLSMEGEGKRAVVAKLEALGIPFVDVGMGLYQREDRIGGNLRMTVSTPENRDFARRYISFANADHDDEYSSNIQIVELNALNAALAVLKWKKLCGFYFDEGGEGNMGYMVTTNTMNNTDLPNETTHQHHP
jgi:hypothetical protein